MVDNYKWNATYGNLMKGQGCSKCAGHIKYTKEEVLENLSKNQA
jgi:hypothetical protein